LFDELAQLQAAEEEKPEPPTPMRDHHEFARLLGITDEPDGYNPTNFTLVEKNKLRDFVC
jgi:hypothetical protein